MLKLVALSGTMLLSALSFAQDRVIVPIEAGETPVGFVDLNDHGFMIKIAQANDPRNLQWRLSYYTPTLDLVWQAPLTADHLSVTNIQSILTDPSGSYVYQLQRQRDKSLTATQIDKKGQNKTFDVDKATIKQLKGREEVRFCNDQALYLATLYEGNKRVPTQLFLNAFSHKDFSFSQRIVDLPTIDVRKFTAQWEYAGHSTKHLWLVSKSVSSDREAYQCQLIAIDWEGKITKKVILNNQLADAYLRASRSVKHSPGAELMHSGSAATFVNMNHMSGMSHSTTMLGTDAWANVRVDEANGIIYTYGLFGPTKSKARAAYVDGYHVTAYDMEGKQRWQQRSAANDPILSDNQFRKHLTYDLRTVSAQPLGDKAFRLQVSSPKNIYTYEFSLQGKILDTQQVSAKDYRTQISKRTTHFISSSSQGDVLIQFNQGNLSLLRQ